MTDFSSKVQAGIRLLDTEQPGWRDLVDLDSLNLGSCSVCVLGQVFGDYEDGLSELALEEDDAYRLGFNTMGGMSSLTEAWKEALGPDNTLVEKGDVYRNKYGDGVKVLQTHVADVDGSPVSFYVVLAGTVSSGQFTAYGHSQPAVLTRENFGASGSYSVKVGELSVKAGMFLINANSEKFYAVTDTSLRPLEDGASVIRLVLVDRTGMKEMTLPDGAPFSSTLVK